MANRGDPEAQLALDLYCYRIKKVPRGLHGGARPRGRDCIYWRIGENAAPIRRKCCEGLEAFGITVDDVKTRGPTKRSWKSSETALHKGAGYQDK